MTAVLAGNSGQMTCVAQLREHYAFVRDFSMRLAAPLSAEDQMVQSMPDASPTKWHLAHSTWFFEEVVLSRFGRDYSCFDPSYTYLFNSYYEGFGPRHPRPERGLLSRPSLNEIMAYRRHVDGAMEVLLRDLLPDAAPLVTLGLHHEQQHQELILTDIKHALYANPLRPAYLSARPEAMRGETPLEWVGHGGGIVSVGHDGNGFHFDNEAPRHEVLLRPFRIASRVVRCGEYLRFIEDGGYDRAEFWLSDGWALARAEGWRCPLYWQQGESSWQVFTLHGLKRLDPQEALAHVSFYEAAAYARWAGARLPTEFEWEAARGDDALSGEVWAGEVWEWTGSAYAPYPGYRPFDGVLAEYNGKFMSGQMVLRGGSQATPPGHVRRSYRNFFPPSARWQFSGIRLARDGLA